MQVLAALAAGLHPLDSQGCTPSLMSKATARLSNLLKSLHMLYGTNQGACGSVWGFVPCSLVAVLCCAAALLLPLLGWSPHNATGLVSFPESHVLLITCHWIMWIICTAHDTALGVPSNLPLKHAACTST